jgi:tight adherence protein C
MTAATLVAGLAGLLAAVGLVELAVVVADARAARGTEGEDASGDAPRWAQVLTGLGRRIGAPAAPGDLAARLDAAGLPATVRTADAMAAKAGGALAVALLALPVVAALPTRLALVLTPAAAAAGFLLPDWWLRRRARRRVARAQLELPDVLDLLCVAVEAGLPTSRALQEVGRRRGGGVVAAELRAVAARLALGVPRAQALTALQRRLPLPAVAALATAVARADRHGAPLAPALRALAEQARADRARRLHDHAASAAPRIQLAVALLLVPAVLLLVAAGVVDGLA